MAGGMGRGQPMGEVAANWEAVRERVARAAARVGRDPQEIRIIAVGKTVPVERIREAIEAGVTDLGENRVQEARQKIGVLGRGPRWHLIGHLQRNKVKYLFDLFDLVHSVDSLALAREIDHEGRKRRQRIEVLVQVNLGGEETKSGLEPTELQHFLEETASLSSLSIRGLMSIPPFLPDPEEVRPFFRQLKRLAR
ncbi:MAG: YggS family pyridoxal phosphate-dependent enzyme, partial [Candidatus Binatia bacterium]